MLVTVLIALALVTLGVLHWRLCRLPSPWYGAILPALWLTTVAVLHVQGHLDSGVRYAAVAMVAVALARIWGEGRTARTAVTAHST